MADPTQNEPVDSPKWHPVWLAPSQHDDLLFEHEDFGFQRCSRPKQVSHQTEDQPAEIAHPTQDRPILSRLPTGSDLRQGHGAETAEDGIAIAKKFTLKDVAENIACPFLITHGANDRVVPVENAQKLFDAVGSQNKTIKIFTTEEGGAEHAHVDNRQVGIDFAADWIEDNLKAADAINSG